MFLKKFTYQKEKMIIACFPEVLRFKIFSYYSFVGFISKFKHVLNKTFYCEKQKKKQITETNKNEF